MVLSKTIFFKICVFAVCIQLGFSAPKFRCVDNPECPELILTSQHNVWTRTDFIEFDPEDPTAENEALATNARKDHVGIPEELIATKQPNVFKVKRVVGDPNVDEVSLVVLRPKFKEAILAWIDTYNIIIYEKNVNRVQETECIVTEINKLFEKKVITKVISGLHDLDQHRILISHEYVSSMGDIPIVIELFKWNRLLEPSTEDVFGLIADNVLQMAKIIKLPELGSATKDANLKSWQPYSSEIFKDPATLLNYVFSNTPKTLKEFINNKLSTQLEKQVECKTVNVMRFRRRKTSSDDNVYDVILLINGGIVDVPCVMYKRRIDLSYIEFKQPTLAPQIIYASELIDSDVVDYPRNTINIEWKSIPSLADSGNPDNNLDYVPMPYPTNLNNPKDFTLVFGLNQILVYIYDVTLGNNNEVMSITDDFTGQDLTGLCPALAKKYNERLSEPSSSFTVRYVTNEEGYNNIVKNKFVILSDGIIDHLKDLVGKYNIVIASNTPGALEKAIVDTLERKVGQIFSRRFTSRDYVRSTVLKDEVLEAAGFVKEKTVHINVDLANFSTYLYRTVIDIMEPPYVSGLAKVKPILMDDLYTALQQRNEPKILAALKIITNMRFKCINNTLAGNLIISVENLRQGNFQIPSTYLRRWISHFNIIPHSATGESMELILNAIEKDAKEKIFSRNFITKPVVLANTIFIVAKADHIKPEYRKQTILVSDCGFPFLQALSNLIRNIQLTKGPLPPPHSIEAFNLREYVDINTATRILGTITPVEEIAKLRVVDLKNNCTRSLKRATNFSPTKIFRIKKTYSIDEMTGTTFELMGKNSNKEVFMVSYLSETLSEIRYLITEMSDFTLQRKITEDILKAKCKKP